MKKSLAGLGLAGLLAIIGSSANALETNEKGFPVPDKNNAEPIVASLGNANIVLKIYRLPKGNRLEEYVVNNKTGLYVMVIRSNKRESYVIEDRNCDNIFETKYTLEEFENSDPQIPECYLK